MGKCTTPIRDDGPKRIYFTIEGIPVDGTILRRWFAVALALVGFLALMAYLSPEHDHSLHDHTNPPAETAPADEKRYPLLPPWPFNEK